jgi:outer membrane receptor protein involved in Fe transport
MSTSPRFSFRVLLLACGLVLPSTVGAQQPPATVDTTRHVQRLAPQRISGTRLAPLDSASGAVGVHADLISLADVRRVTPGPASAAQLIGGLNGVSNFDDQGTRAQPTIDLRGWTLSPVVGIPQGISVFLDGVRINEADAQEVNFDLIPTEAIVSAAVVRGPVALYGRNSLAGAVLLTTARGDAPRVESNVSLGRFGYRDAHVLASGSTDSKVGALDALLLVRGSDEDGFRQASAAKTRMLFANIGRRSRDPGGADVGLSVEYAHDRVYQPGSLPESLLDVDPRINYTAGDFFAPDLLHIALRASAPLGLATLRGNAVVRRNTTEQFNVNLDAPSSWAHIGATTVGSTFELDLPLRMSSRQGSLTLGAEVSRDLVRYRIAAEPTADSPAIPADCDAFGLCDDVRVDDDNAALFGQLMLPLIAGADASGASSPLALTLAARADYARVPIRDLRDPSTDGTSTFSRVSPRAALAYHGTHGSSAYVAVSTAFRTPAPLELVCADEQAPCVLPFALGDDPPLSPVTVVNYEVGGEWAPAAWLTTNLSAYDSEIRNEIVFAASSLTAGFFRNIPRTQRRGVEVSAQAERSLSAGTVRAFARYGYVSARYRSTVQLASSLPNEPAVIPGDRFPLSPTQRATTGVGATVVTHSAVFDADIRARFVSGQFLRGDEANTQSSLPGYGIVTAHLASRIARYTIAVNADNLFDRRYVSFGTFAPDVRGTPDSSGQPPVVRFLTPGYPRTFTLSLTATW